MVDGWIKLHRQLLESAVFSNANLLKVWVWCLCKATHKETKIMVGLQCVCLDAGQFVFGRKAASVELGIKESSAYKYIKTLETMGMLSIKSNNKFSVVTIEKWGIYQSESFESNNNVTTAEQQRNNNVTTAEQQRNTNKNAKNAKNVKNVKNNKERVDVDTVKAIQELYNSVCVSLPTAKVLNDARKREVKARMKNDGFTLDTFKELFQRAEESDFCKGNNDRGWKADFDFLISQKGSARTLEGKYNNSGMKKPDDKWCNEENAGKGFWD